MQRKESVEMFNLILFWFCVALTALSVIVTLKSAFTEDTALKRVISFIAFLHHLSVLYLLASSYL